MVFSPRIAAIRPPDHRHEFGKETRIGTILARAKKDGTISYTAVIRKKKAGKVVPTLSQTFPNERAARRWITQRERELGARGTMDRMIQARKRKTWGDVIMDYCAASPDGFGKAKTANLAYAVVGEL